VLSFWIVVSRQHIVDLAAQFKNVNDRFGHRAGDLVLMRVGQRLGGLVRGSDSAARIGGDEFALVLPEIETPAQAAAIGQRAIELLNEPMDLGLGDVPAIGASVGIAVFAASEENPAALFERADRALYRSKREGKGRVSAESPPDTEVAPSAA
jgi:diguanylate cyclase (GGDEF)-like protein